MNNMSDIAGLQEAKGIIRSLNIHTYIDDFRHLE